MSLDQFTDDELEPHLIAGRYELGAVIGIGSSAVVRRAYDLRDGVAVAVKHFHPGASIRELRQQQREMATLARLHHPGLVGLRDGGTEDGRRFVVTDLVEGPTLAERIRDGLPLRPRAVRRLGGQLASALAHVHASGFVHRDVKPANVLLGDGHRPRLADFGIACALDRAAALTADGCVVGTAAYLAPEQVRGEYVGPATDVYALGLVLLEALTGRREYPGGAVESATARLYRRPAVPEGLPSDLVSVLEAATHAEPRHRPGADDVAAALDAWPLAPAGGSETSPAPSVLHRGGRHRRRSTTVWSLAAAALVVTVGGLGGLPGSDQRPTAQDGATWTDIP